MFSCKGRCTGADCEANYVFIVREMSITIERTGKVRHSYKQPVRRQLRGFRRGAIKKLIAAKTSQHDIVQQSRVGASAEKRQGGNLSDELKNSVVSKVFSDKNFMLKRYFINTFYDIKNDIKKQKTPFY